MKHSHKHIYKRHMVLAGVVGALFGLLTGLSGIWFTSAATSFTQTFLTSGIYGKTFSLPFDVTATGGNGGQIIFLTGAEEIALGGSGLTYDATTTPQRLDGNFWIETVGWATMTGVQLLPSASVNIMSLSGAAWSENAGWIDFGGGGITTYGVDYIPGSRTFSGYAWSDNLGYIALTGSGGQTFMNKVKILGNIGGAKSFDTDYALGPKFDSVTTASLLNTVRKNTSLLTRGFLTTPTGTKTLNSIVYHKTTSTTPISASPINTNRSLIVEGGNILISADVANAAMPRTLIALKDAQGNGGNIYIAEGVKNIYATLVAEGSVYSGLDSANLYNDNATELTQLPNAQLYILGSVISRNTIGGASKTPAICPYNNVGTCDSLVASKYDLNYFRTYDGTPAKKSAKTGFDGFSVIIESDGRLLQNPPPGL